MELEFGGAASFELRSAAIEHEEQRKGRGERFLDAVALATRQLSEFPESGNRSPEGGLRFVCVDFACSGFRPTSSTG